MTGIETKIDASSATVEMIANKVNVLATNFDALKAHVTTLETRITQMELNEHHPVANSDFLDQIKSTVQNITDSKLEVRTLQLETQLLADEITIGGLPEMRNEKLMDTVVLLSKALKVTVTEADVIKVERLGKEVRAKSRNIRVKFSNQKHVNNVMINVRYADNKPPVKLLPSTGLELLQNLLD
ncbi:hypothetical protein KQX54_010191 [Cotesia glomerata]|uniref:Uncharacterized protein n=1 Tax=Cotesia glomerata TaxID=32391 RepID=A0AAV7IHF1_COTGL|nr:hypothetical protein KQX54_010191 [Cotesia glomerata]